jgi:hypothetical protein
LPPEGYCQRGDTFAQIDVQRQPLPRYVFALLMSFEEGTLRQPTSQDERLSKKVCDTYLCAAKSARAVSLDGANRQPIPVFDLAGTHRLGQRDGHRTASPAAADVKG